MEDVSEVVVGGRARRRATPYLILVVALVVVGALVASQCLLSSAPRSPLDPAAGQASAAGAVAQGFLEAWRAQDWAALQGLTEDQSLDAGGVHRQAVEAVGVTDMRFTLGKPQLEGTSATVDYSATWTLGELGKYDYDGELQLVRTDDPASSEDSATAPTGPWRVHWWYTTVHPSLSPDDRFERLQTWPRRAPILDRAGAELVSSRRLVAVGVVPAFVSDRREVVDALTGILDVTPRAVRSALSGPPDQFAEVDLLPLAQFEALRPQLAPVSGVVFRHRQRRIAAQRAVASPLLGSVGEITAEQLSQLGDPYRAGDIVGRSALEERFEQRLAGSPSVEAAITDDVGVVRSLGFAPGTPARPVNTTLDVRMQRAAEAVLAGAPAPAALVAIDVETGAVRAIANNPAGGFNRALSGLYPPGSTFKIVTATAVLQRGTAPSARLGCPGTVRLSGPPISNAGRAAYGRVSLKRAFALSCNTTFARLGTRVGEPGMVATAERFGFNRDVDFTLPAATAKFPDPDGTAELARASIGQGRVQVTPLAMASIAAAAASGAWRPPTLVTGEASPARPLPPGVPAKLRSMMRAVVTSGTGRAADLPGTPVYGKTGSAQFGDGSRTHAWFTGFRGNVAVAVLVESGGGGGAVAAPIARAFFAALQRDPEPGRGRSGGH